MQNNSLLHKAESKYFVQKISYESGVSPPTVFAALSPVLVTFLQLFVQVPSATLVYKLMLKFIFNTGCLWKRNGFQITLSTLFEAGPCLRTCFWVQPKHTAGIAHLLNQMITVLCFGLCPQLDWFTSIGIASIYH